MPCPASQLLPHGHSRAAACRLCGKFPTHPTMGPYHSPRGIASFTACSAQAISSVRRSSTSSGTGTPKACSSRLALRAFGQARCRRAQVSAPAAGALAGQIHADFTFGAAHNAHQFFFRFLGAAPNAPAHRHLFLRFLLQMADLFSGLSAALHGVCSLFLAGFPGRSRRRGLRPAVQPGFRPPRHSSRIPGGCQESRPVRRAHRRTFLALVANGKAQLVVSHAARGSSWFRRAAAPP